MSHGNNCASALIMPQGAPSFQQMGATDYHRVENFQSGLTPICGRFTVAPARKDGIMQARLGCLKRAGYEIALIGLDAIYTERDARSIRTAPCDNVFIIFQQTGQAIMYQDGMKVILNAGDIFICDSARPARFEFGGKYSQQYSLHLQRKEAASRFGGRLRSGLRLKCDDHLSLAARSVMQRMLLASPEAKPQAPLPEALFAILEAFLADATPSADLHPSLILDKALHEISVRYADPALGPQELADRLGISLRSLQRAFEKIGETPRQRIAAVRLERAYEYLKGNYVDMPQQSVTDIAFLCGFNDLSHFYKMFRRRFDIAPGEVISQFTSIGPITTLPAGWTTHPRGD